MAEDYRNRRQVLRREDRERLLRYVRSIIDQNTTSLSDILRVHVLPHLPVQSLRRFLLVSHSWHAHISTSPFFSHTQSRTHRSLSGFFYHLSYLPLDPRTGSLPDPFLSFVPDSVSVVASSDGLVACQSILESSRIYVCNPSTQEWTALPRFSPQSSHVFETVLVFQPSALDFTADYYVVRISYLSGLDVFSSSLGTWRTSAVRVPNKLRRPWSSVAVEGIAYWPNEDETVSRYDPKADRLTFIARPQMEMRRWQLAEMGGRLCCVAGKEGMVAVWGLERGTSTEKWRELVRVEMEGDPWPLVSEGKEDRAVVRVDSRIVGIDVRTGEVTVIREGGVMESDVCVPYISSLVAVKEFCFGIGCFTCRHGYSYS